MFARGAPWLVLFALACDGDGDHLATSIDRVYDATPTGDAALDSAVDPDVAVDSDAAVDSAVDSDAAVDSAVDPDVAVDSAVDSDAAVDSDVAVDSDAAVDSDVAGPTAPDLRHPHPALPQLSAAVLAKVAAEADDVLADLRGASFSGLIIDLDTGQTVWSQSPDLGLIPASNTKVFTTAAAIDLLGPDHRMLTRVIAPGPITNGAVASLELHGEHDFTWSHWFYANPREPADRLADALWQAGLRRVTGAVGVWGAYLYEGYHFGSYDPATHRTRAGNAFIAALNARGITVGGGLIDHATMEVPAGTELARWLSIPLHVGAWAVNRRSHNEMADILARHLGYVMGGSSDYPTGAQVIRGWLADNGVDVDGFTLGDGSGLDTANRVSARQLVGAYRVMARSAAFEEWRASLTIGGGGGPASVDGNGTAIVTSNVAPYMGTLAGRLTGADTAGRVFGKSGTNDGITTSGVLYHRYDGHRYAFGFLMNDVADYDAARALQDSLVEIVAQELEPRGTRPAAPTLGCVRTRADGLVEVAVTGALPDGDARAGYALELSPDGVRFDRAEALFTNAPPFVVARPDGVLYVRARAESSAGVSDPSDVYAVRARGESKVLLIDADDRWQRQPTNENPMGAAHRFMALYAAAMPARLAFDTCPNEALTDGAVALDDYDAVVWSAGEEATTDESFSAAEQALVGAYLDGGGALFASGAEIAWDLDAAGNTSASAADEAFARERLAVGYGADDAGVYVVEGAAGGLFADLHHERRLGFWTPGAIFVAYPDTFVAVGSDPSLVYLASGSPIAAVQSRETPAVVTFGFPFESLDAAPERALVMERVMGLFGL